MARKRVGASGDPCPRCGTEVEVGANFCPSCGLPRSEFPPRDQSSEAPAPTAIDATAGSTAAGVDDPVPPPPANSIARPPWRRYIVPGGVAAAIILGLVLIIPWLGSGGGVGGTDYMLLAEQQSDGTSDLYLVRFGEDAVRERRVADGVTGTDIVALSVGQESSRVGSFGGFFDSDGVLLGYRTDDRSHLIVGRFPMEDGGTELFDSNDTLSVAYTEDQLFVQEFSGSSTRCYLGTYQGPIDRAAKGDTCYAVGVNQGEVLVAESEIDGDEESVRIFDGATELYRFDRAAGADPVRTSGLGDLLLVPDFDSGGEWVRVLDARSGEELFETDEGTAVEVIGVSARSDRALVVLDDGQGELVLLAIDRQGVFEVARGGAIQATISDDGRWVVFQAPADPDDDEVTVLSLDLDSGDSPQAVALFTADGFVQFDLRGSGAASQVVAAAVDTQQSGGLSDVEIFAGPVAGPVISVAVFDDVSDGEFVVAGDDRLLSWLVADGELIVSEIDLSRGTAVESTLEWDRASFSAVDRSGRILMIATDRDESVLAIWSPQAGSVEEVAVEDFILWAGFGPGDEIVYVAGDTPSFGDSELRSVASDGSEVVLYRDVDPVAIGWEAVDLAPLARNPVRYAFVDPIAAACRADGIELATGPVTRYVQATQASDWQICVELEAGNYQVLVTSYNGVDLVLFGEGPVSTIYDDDSGNGADPLYGPDFLESGVWRFSVTSYLGGASWSADFEFRLERF